MISRELLSFKLFDKDVELLPFFDRTRSSTSFVYFCRQYAAAAGGDVIVMTNKGGICSAFVYFTGPLMPSISFLSEDDSGTARDIVSGQSRAERLLCEVQAAFEDRGVDGAYLDRELEHRQPRVECETRIACDAMADVLTAIMKCDASAPTPSLATHYERIVAFDGSVVRGLTSDDGVSRWGEIRSLISQTVRLAVPVQCQHP